MLSLSGTLKCFSFYPPLLQLLHWQNLSLAQCITISIMALDAQLTFNVNRSLCQFAAWFWLVCFGEDWCTLSTQVIQINAGIIMLVRKGLHHFHFKFKKVKTKFKNRNFKFKKLKSKFKNRNFKLKKVESKFKNRNFKFKKVKSKFKIFLST